MHEGLQIINQVQIVEFLPLGSPFHLDFVPLEKLAIKGSSSRYALHVSEVSGGMERCVDV